VVAGASQLSGVVVADWSDTYAGPTAARQTRRRHRSTALNITDRRSDN